MAEPEWLRQLRCDYGCPIRIEMRSVLAELTSAITATRCGNSPTRRLDKAMAEAADLLAKEPIL